MKTLNAALIWVGLFLLLSMIGVNALDNTTVTNYYKLDTTILDTLSNSNLTNVGSTNVTGIIGYGRNTSYGYLKALSGYNQNTTIKSSSLWIYPSSITGQYLMIAGGGSEYYISGNQIYLSGRLGAPVTSWNVTINLSQWHNLIVTTDGSTTKLYYDGVLLPRNGTAYNPSSFFQSSSVVYWGNHSSSNLPFLGVMDEIALFNVTLNQSQVIELYNSGLGFQYPFLSSLPTLTFSNISLINNSYFNTTTFQINTSVLNSSTNGNVNQTYNLYYNNGTLVNSTQYVTNNVTGQFNISGLTENKYYLNINASNNQTSVLSNNLNFTVDLTLPTINNNILSEYNYYNISGFNSTCTDTNLNYCNITINGRNVALNTTSFNFTTNGNQSYNITAVDLAGNIKVLSNLTLINPYQFFYFSNGSTAITNFTFAGINYTNYVNVTLYNSILTFGSNSLLFQKLGFAATYVNFTTNSTSSINLTTNITQSRIIINIYDRVTGNLITPSTTTIQLISSIGYNTTTTSGQANISNISFINETYTVIASNPNYYTETSYFNYDNRQALNVNLYLINTSLANYGVVTVQLITSNGQRVNAALCSLQEWKPATSAYLTVAQGQTNINGEYQFNIEVANKFYRIYCEKLGQSAISTGQLFTSTGMIIPLQIGDAISTPTLFLKGITGNVTYNNVTQLVTFNFNDRAALSDTFCLNVYNVTGIYHPLISQSCNVTSSGSLYASVSNNQTNTVQAIGTVIIDGITYTIDSVTISGNNSIEKILHGYNLDIILPLVLMLLGIVIGLTLKPANIFISIILSIVGVWLGTALVPSIVSSTIAIFITLICILMMWGGYKPK